MSKLRLLVLKDFIKFDMIQIKNMLKLFLNSHNPINFSHISEIQK